MAITKRQDGEKGWSGSGIDQERGDEWVVKQTDDECTRAMYGKQALDPGVSMEGPYGEHDEEGDSGNKLLDSARRGNRPLLSKGTPESAEQTGFRKRRSGAY